MFGSIALRIFELRPECQRSLNRRESQTEALLTTVLLGAATAAVLLTERLLQHRDVAADWTYGLPGFAFAAWRVAWTPLVHNATLETSGTVWARRVLIGIAVAGAALPIAGGHSLSAGVNCPNHRCSQARRSLSTACRD